jgi:uncharacterized protein YdeI (YjbR/CyaY-like superfamily)
MNPEVNWFFNKTTKWQEAYQELRNIILETGLTEELKWGVPCYTQQNANIVLIHGFKDYCALLFHKGALLKDDHGLLIQQTKNVQAARQMRFRNVSDVIRLQEVIISYINQAIENEIAGLKVDLKQTSEFEIPAEFQSALDDSPQFKDAFYSLTPGRQRGYLLYFSAAKQSKTREARIEKSYEKILQRKGIED